MKFNKPTDNPLPNQELLIRKAILSFPFQQSQLFQQIVSTVTFKPKQAIRKEDADAEVGGMSAMSCLFNALNGQRLA